ncbi:hypothetical protein HAX54_014500 [Datura stramonium]|uniref:Uncharacterized protein n=1 Tax=Datura stramonium TaxID=4076 RepID=A0ABS8S288_DATST|nr:hypothetical protein [Datura stramonium]
MATTEALSLIPASVLRNLSDKLYEKRKNAALELEGTVKQLAVAGDHDKITAVINLLTQEYTYSPQANHRKGGLIGLAAVTVGLTSEAAQHLEVRHWYVQFRVLCYEVEMNWLKIFTIEVSNRIYGVSGSSFYVGGVTREWVTHALPCATTSFRSPMPRASCTGEWSTF